MNHSIWSKPFWYTGTSKEWNRTRNRMCNSNTNLVSCNDFIGPTVTLDIHVIIRSQGQPKFEQRLNLKDQI